MNNMKRDIAYLGAQIEETNSNVKAILEIVVPMQQDVLQLKEDMVEVKADIKTIKTTLKATIDDVKDHERRITRLETKPT